MTALFNALDNYTPSQVGENGHSELTWSNGPREQILQLSFQLTRCKDEKQIKNLSRVVDQILSQLATDYKIQKIPKAEYLGYMSIMFRLLGQTRDMIDGKVNILWLICSLQFGINIIRSWLNLHLNVLW